MPPSSHENYSIAATAPNRGCPETNVDFITMKADDFRRWLDESNRRLSGHSKRVDKRKH